MSIGRKKNIDNPKWIEVFGKIEELVSADEVNRLEKDVVDEIKKTVAGKKVAYAWSGGKDSIVLGKLCESANITDCMFAHTDLEYPSFLQWCLANKPDSCEVIDVGLDMEWLSKHPEMIFPRDCRTTYHWYQLVQQRAIKSYFKEQNLDMIIVGHRKADGNYVGRGSNISRNSAGVVRYSPIADWTHEQVLAYIHYRGLNLPPIYEWENGYKCGTHPWPARTHTKSIDDGFRSVYSIDKTIVEQAAEYIPEACHFLREEVTK